MNEENLAGKLVRIAREIVAATSSIVLETTANKVATRPIRIDRRVAQESVDRLIDDMRKSYSGRSTDDPIGDRGYAFIDHVTIQDVDGNDKSIMVQYQFKTSGSWDMVLGGGSGKVTRTGEPAIVIKSNGNYTADAFLSGTSGKRFVNEAVSVLMHELTHQADIYVKSVMPTSQRIRTDKELDLVKYYNSPGEVHSYMREIFEEAYRHLPVFLKHFPTNDAVRRLVKLNPTWQHIQKHLTDRNKDVILKGVYQAVQDYAAEQSLQKAASEVVKVARELV